MAKPAEDVRAFLLDLGVAMTMTGDAVSEIQRRLRSIAAAYGYGDALVSVLPTFLLVLLHDGDPPGVRSIDTGRQLRLDQASEVIHSRGAPRRGRSHRPEHSPRSIMRLRRRRASTPPHGSRRTACSRSGSAW